MHKPMESKMLIRGVIHHIIKPLYGRIWEDLAALRLLVETPDGKGNWETLRDIRKSTDFILQDPTGKVIVEQNSDKVTITGRGSQPTAAQIQDLLSFNHMPVEFNQRYLRYTLWELRLGQAVEIAGEQTRNRVVSTRTLGATSPAQHLTSINKIKEGKGDYCLHGRIALVAQPVDHDPERPLALLRLGIQEKDEFNDWADVFPEPPGKLSPFCLDDGTGRVWVRCHPAISDLDLCLPQFKPRAIDDGQAKIYLALLGEAELPEGRQYRNQVWELRLGDQVTVCGEVDTWWMVTYKPLIFKRL